MSDEHDELALEVVDHADVGERADVVLASDWGTRLPKELDVPALRAST